MPIFNNETLPNDQYSYLEVMSTEFNETHVINAGSWRLLENDVFLHQNFLALSAEAGFCELVYSVSSAVSSMSGVWTDSASSLIDGVWLDEAAGFHNTDAFRDYSHLPIWSKDSKSAIHRGFLLYGSSSHPPAISDPAKTIMTSQASVERLRSAFHPELVWQRTESNGSHRALELSNSIVEWHSDKILKSSLVTEDNILTSCATVDDIDQSLVLDGYGVVVKDYPAPSLNSHSLGTRRIVLDCPDSTFCLWDDAENIVLGIDSDMLSSAGQAALELAGCEFVKPWLPDSYYEMLPSHQDTVDPEIIITWTGLPNPYGTYSFNVEAGDVYAYRTTPGSEGWDFFPQGGNIPSAGYEYQTQGRMKLKLAPALRPAGPYCKITAAASLFTVVVTAGAGGLVSQDGGATKVSSLTFSAEYGFRLPDITAYPDSGHSFDKWSLTSGTADYTGFPVEDVTLLQLVCLGNAVVSADFASAISYHFTFIGIYNGGIIVPYAGAASFYFPSNTPEIVCPGCFSGPACVNGDCSTDIQIGNGSDAVQFLPPPNMAFTGGWDSTMGMNAPPPWSGITLSFPTLELTTTALNNDTVRIANVMEYSARCIMARCVQNDDPVMLALTVLVDPAQGVMNAPTNATTLVNSGVPTAIAATANTGFSFDKWVVDSGTVVLGSPDTTASNTAAITSDSVVRATFLSQEKIIEDLSVTYTCAYTNESARENRTYTTGGGNMRTLLENALIKLNKTNPAVALLGKTDTITEVTCKARRMIYNPGNYWKWYNNQIVSVRAALCGNNIAFDDSVIQLTPPPPQYPENKTYSSQDSMDILTFMVPNTKSNQNLPASGVWSRRACSNTNGVVIGYWSVTITGVKWTTGGRVV